MWQRDIDEVENPQCVSSTQFFHKHSHQGEVGIHHLMEMSGCVRCIVREPRTERRAFDWAALLPAMGFASPGSCWFINFSAGVTGKIGEILKPCTEFFRRLHDRSSPRPTRSVSRVGSFSMKSSPSASWCFAGWTILDWLKRTGGAMKSCIVPWYRFSIASSAGATQYSQLVSDEKGSW